MTDVQSESSYIREITDYFCSLAGRVAIISSEETQILMKWRREGVPKQDVLMGIRKAFESGPGSAKFRISGCAGFVEECFRASRSRAAASEPDSRKRPAETGVHSLIRVISLNIGKAAANAGDKNVRDCLNRAGESLASFAGGAGDFYDFLGALRRRTCGELMAGFDSERAGRLKSRALEMTSSGRKFINEREKNKAFSACLDYLILREAGLHDPFSPAEEVGKYGKVR